jgi:hypothetical protein
MIIEDCLIDGDFSGAARGVSEERTGGGELSSPTRQCAMLARSAF